MRVRGLPLQQVLLGVALLAAVVFNFAKASEIKELRVSAGPTGTRAELRLDAQAEYRLISLSGPDRLVVDFPGSRLAPRTAAPAAAGVVTAVRTGQPAPGTTRVVFDLATPVVALAPRFEAGADGVRLVLEWPGDHGPAGAPSAAASAAADRGIDPIARIAAASQSGAAPAAAPAADPARASAEATSRLIANLPAAGARAQAAPSTASPQRPQPSSDPSPRQAVPTTIATGVPTPVRREAAAQAAPPAPASAAQSAASGATRPLVIAIDAGHGGQDPGAVGPTGKREKDITLAIARELARQVNATAGLKAHLVRDADVFIPLNQRARIARAAGADMFISIHADAAENRNAKGSSVYVLSLKGASSQRARWLADKENAADLIGGGKKVAMTDSMLTNVLLDLTQSGQMKASEDAGNHILQGLKRIGNNHKPHIERANFAVLRTSDMPAMLVETAFLSNPEEEKRLIDPAFQSKVARAVLDGVQTYFTSQPPPGTLFAQRAGAGGGASVGVAAGGSR